MKGESKEKEILDLISNDPYLSAEDIARKVNLSKDGVGYHLKNLKKKKLVKRRGHGKGGSWEVLA
ncbi:MAG: winged helix-turn-helix domain-containing protein [Nanoarchaeota archaeon]